MPGGVWLVTGGLGFIGVNLVHRLVSQGRTVRVLDDGSSRGRDALDAALAPGSVEVVLADVRDAAAVRRALDGVDTVVHLAARAGVLPSIADPRGDFDHNVNGLFTTLLAAREERVGRFVFASSHAPLGDREPPLREDHPLHPLSPYAASKAAGEAYCLAFHASYGLATTVLRFANVYGPHCGHKGTVVAEFLRRARRGEPLVVRGDGRQSRDFVHVRDLADAVIRASERGAGGEILHIASGRETTILELAALVQEVARCAGAPAPVIAPAAAVAGEVRRSCSDISRARASLGWEPRVPLEDGLREVWEWLGR